MPVVVVHLDRWLADQHLLGEPVPARWQRVAAAAGLHLVLADGDPPPADVVVDGRALTLEADDLLEVLGGTALVLEAGGGPGDAGDDRTVPRVHPDGRHAHAGRVIAVPGRSAALLGTVAPVTPRRSLDPWRHAPCDDVVALRSVEARALARRHERELARGVRFVGAPPFLGPEVELAPGAEVWPGCFLLGRTRVGPGAVLHAGCHLRDTEVDAGAVLHPYTVADGARVGAGAAVGPFARLREGTVLGEQTHVGNFVETKKAVLGPGAKANHLAYLGDCEVGARSNVGAGTITCNYDGARKHFTSIGADVFVGTNSALVAPLTVGDGALVAAGSVVVEDVPPGALAVARGEQRTVPEKGAAILARNRRAREQG